MSDLDVTLATGLIVLVSAVVQSMTGFGFAVLATPLLVLLWKPVDAVAISMALSTLSVALLWPRVRRAERLPIVRTLFLAALVGLPLGLWALTHVELRWLRWAIGAVTLATVAVLAYGARRQVRDAPAAAPPTVLTVTAGLFAGAFTGALSMPGPPAVMLLMGVRAPKTAYRATLTTFALLIYPVGLAAMAAEGLISGAVIRQALIQAPVAAIAVYLGDRLHGAVSERQFSGVSLLLLGLSGALCLIRG
ncbi:MAG: sulfite exporter TauE/SafE family protein [Caulobacterales bacterium]